MEGPSDLVKVETSEREKELQEIINRQKGEF